MFADLQFMGCGADCECERGPNQSCVLQEVHRCNPGEGQTGPRYLPSLQGYGRLVLAWLQRAIDTNANTQMFEL